MPARKPEEAHSLYEEKMNAGDLEGLCDLFTDDAVIVPQPGAEPISGMQEIREFKKGFFALNPTISMETKFTVEYGDIALLRSKWHFTGTTADGDAVDMTHNGTEIVQRQSDGTWKYIIDHPFGAD
jgi:uncharacterized protein (TIGR02246 family)